MDGGRNVRDFQFYVTDSRYAVPSLMMVTTMSEADARRTAERMLAEPHHHAVDARERGQRLFTLSETHASG